jgi:PHD/YefM family antitoxin component YafN of YafNO toxin-antitoxin module
MRHLSGFNEIEARLHMTMESLSNRRDDVVITDEMIDIAAEEFKASLKRQLQPTERTFKLRASNIGRPLCQLQSENNGLEKSSTDYNHIVRMLYGDATEAIMNLIIRASGVDVTGAKTRVANDVNGTIIEGEDDIEIADKVYDVKSCSSYAYAHKWAGGWESLFHTDSFGYVEQLYMYAGGDPKRMGGWIVVEKSSGEVKVVEAQPTPEQIEIIKERISRAERAITLNEPFQQQFFAEPETFYKKPTGNYLVPMTCTFCDYMKHCWPNAELLPKQASKSESPKPVWYAYTETGK